MVTDCFNLSLIVIVFLIYGSICLISLIFTFSLNIYMKLEEVLSFAVTSYDINNPLNISINSIDNWLIKHNKIVGPILVLLSALDGYLFIGIIL